MLSRKPYQAKSATQIDDLEPVADDFVLGIHRAFNDGLAWLEREIALRNPNTSIYFP
jgi:hypothetical protein